MQLFALDHYNKVENIPQTKFAQQFYASYCNG